MHRSIAALFVLAFPAFAHAQKNATIPDPDPELERKSFIVAPGFEVNLFAADPLLAKPIQMNWDPQGRLWVATSEVYPQIKPGEKANDKIIILEDTKGTGKADKTTVFADGLLIPTGIEPGDGGAYVANSTELVHLSASKPGGKADRTRVLLSGFGTEDTHHIIHTFRWGPDQSLYFNQSIYIHSHIETPHGVKRLNGGGVWRYKPDTHELDVFVRGFVNPWGHAFDRWGQSFITDGAGVEGINHAIPGASYATAVGASRILHGMNPGSPKHCGLEVASGRHLPDDWQGDLITNDFRGHRVCRFKLSDDGSTFASREMPELIKTNHPAFRPIDVKMGPDGAIYIADWYNPIIQHGEVDFRDPRRDHVHGRIWRVTAKGRPLVKKPELVNAKTTELLERLKDPEDWTRQQAKRVLKERGKEKVLPVLVEKSYDWPLPPRTGSKSLNANGVHNAVEDLRLLLGFNLEDEKSLLVMQSRGFVASLSLYEVPSAGTVAARVLGDWGEQYKDGIGVLLSLVESKHPQIRLEAVRALAKHKSTAALEAALKALDKPMDRTLDYALWLTVRELEPYWMPEFKAGNLTFGGDPKKIAFVLNAVGGAEAAKPLVKLIDSGKVPKENLHELWLLLARVGGPDEMELVLSHMFRDESLSDASRMELILAVENSVRTRKVGPSAIARGGKSVLIDLYIRSLRPEFRSLLPSYMRLIGLWKLEAERSLLTSWVKNGKAPAELRNAALEGLVLLGGQETEFLFDDLLEPSQPAELRRQVIAAWVPLNLNHVAWKAAEFLTEAKSVDGLDSLYAAFLARKDAPDALAKELTGKKLDPDVAKLGLRVIRASGQTPQPLIDALTKAGNLQVQQKEPTPEEVKTLVAESLKIGDPKRGEIVFRRKDMQCVACHGIGGAGGQVGPDLTSIGASAQPDYLVESLRIPNKAVKEGYHALRVVTDDDKVFLGIKLRETDSELVLRTPEDKEISIPVKSIAEKGNTRSLMPDGLTDPLTRQEFADLTRFLSELGKIGPYAPNRSRLVRRWQAVEPMKENLSLIRRNRAAVAAEPHAALVWSPLYSRVAGELPLEEVPKFVMWDGAEPMSIVRCQLDVTTAGPVKLKLDSAEGIVLYAGANPVAVQAETVLELPKGVQTLTFLIDRTKRKTDLRCELEDAPGSPARAAVVGGK